MILRFLNWLSGKPDICQACADCRYDLCPEARRIMEIQ